MKDKIAASAFGLLAMTPTLSLRGSAPTAAVSTYLVTPRERSDRGSLAAHFGIAASACGLLAMTPTMSLRGAAPRSSLAISP